MKNKFKNILLSIVLLFAVTGCSSKSRAANYAMYGAAIGGTGGAIQGIPSPVATASQGDSKTTTRARALGALLGSLTGAVVGYSIGFVVDVIND